MPEANVLSPPGAASGGPRRWLSNLLYRQRNLTMLLMLTPPLIWFGVVYVGSLLTLLTQSLLTFDEMSMSVLIEPTLQNFQSLAVPANLDIVLRTLGMAIAVTLGAVTIGFPMAYYMAHYARPWEKGVFLCRCDVAHVGQLHRQGLCMDGAAGPGWHDLLGAQPAGASGCS